MVQINKVSILFLITKDSRFICSTEHNINLVIYYFMSFFPNRCFNGGKTCCYKLLALLCGCWLALFWGCEFACITFCHVWYFTPGLRGFAINCGCCQKLWGTCLQCFLAPICETAGLCLSRIGLEKTEMKSTAQSFNVVQNVK